jgi:hypothetical protein
MAAVSGTPSWFALERRSSDAVTAGDLTITPQSRVLTLRLSGGAFVWHRPVMVLVRQGGRSTVLPIRDITRLMQCALIGGAVLAALVGRLLATREKETAP